MSGCRVLLVNHNQTTALKVVCKQQSPQPGPGAGLGQVLHTEKRGQIQAQGRLAIT